MTKENLSAVIGKNIRNERLARNMSIEQLAEMLGLSASAVGLMERGDRGTTALSMFKISEAFDVPVDYFFQDENSPQEKDTSRHSEASALLTGFSEAEMDFVIATIKGLRKFRGLK